MEREKLGSTGNPDTRSQPEPSTNNSSPIIPSVGTFAYASAMSGTSHNEIPHSEVSEENVTVPPRTSFPRVASTFTTTRWAARPTTGRRQVTERTDEYKTKTSPPGGDEAISVAFTSKVSQDVDRTVDMSLVSPGAVSIPGFSLAGSTNNELNNPSELESSVLGKGTSSLVVAAELVTEQDEDLENRIKQEVESRLKKHDPTFAVAEVVPPITTTCKLFCWKWKYPLLLILLGICGSIVGAKISSRSDETPAPTVPPTSRDEQPTRNSTRDNETQARIQEVLGRYLTFEEDPTNNSPQSRALDWLMHDDTNNLMQNGTISDTVILERYVLAVFYYSTNGNTWLNQLEFLTPATVCQWNNGSMVSPYGVFCDADGTVQQIDLWANYLSGALSSELSLLSNLQSLSLEFNMLGNVIPTELGRLTALHKLFLGDNSLNGTLPTELGNLVALEMLSLGYNQWTGIIPTEYGQLTNVQFLEVSGNDFSGSLPTELGLMTSLTTIYVDYTGLTGTLPTELGRLTNLALFSMTFNGFTGQLPTELGLMTSVTAIYVNDNWLTGTLPTELGLMTSLTDIVAAYNFFTGTLPTELSQLTALELLHVYNNYLNGTVPEELLSKSNLLVDFDPQLRPEEIGGN